jgi:hypothetical protein
MSAGWNRKKANPGPRFDPSYASSRRRHKDKVRSAPAGSDAPPDGEQVLAHMNRKVFFRSCSEILSAGVRGSVVRRADRPELRTVGVSTLTERNRLEPVSAAGRTLPGLLRAGIRAVSYSCIVRLKTGGGLQRKNFRGILPSRRYPAPRECSCKELEALSRLPAFRSNRAGTRPLRSDPPPFRPTPLDGIFIQ